MLSYDDTKTLVELGFKCNRMDRESEEFWECGGWLITENDDEVDKARECNLLRDLVKDFGGSLIVSYDDDEEEVERVWICRNLAQCLEVIVEEERRRVK